MTGQEVGHLYRALLHNDGWFVLSSVLSDDAAYDMYNELERFGFNYYPERYKNASLDEKNGFKEEIQNLKELFKKKSRYLLEMSGKNSDFIEKNYEEFANKLFNFYVSKRVKNIHTLLNSNDASLRQILDDFERNNEVNNMSNSDEKNNQEEREIILISNDGKRVKLVDRLNSFSTPWDYMEFLREISDEYDSFLNNSQFSDEEKERIRENRENLFLKINLHFLNFLSTYSSNLIESAIVTPLDDREKLDTEINGIINIYRAYFRNDELADNLQRRYDDALASVNVLETEPVQDVVSDFNDEEQEDLGHDEVVETTVSESDENVLTAIQGNEDSIHENISDLEDRRILETDKGEMEDDSSVVEEKEYLDLTVPEDDAAGALEEKEVFEELDSFDGLDDYSTLSNDGLLEEVNNLISRIKRAQMGNSSDLSDLLLKAARVQSELDSRLNSKRKEVSRDDDSLSGDRKLEAEKIRRSKHFTEVDKDDLVAGLYDEDDYDFEGDHFEGSHLKR